MHKIPYILLVGRAVGWLEDTGKVYRNLALSEAEDRFIESVTREDEDGAPDGVKIVAAFASDAPITTLYQVQ